MKRLAAWSCLVLCFAAAPRAWADDDRAREQAKIGIDRYDRGDFAGALEAFRAAYFEKPSAGIKRNIALCHKALGHPVDAARAFDEALDEGASLKPEVRTAIEQELAVLAKSVATTHFRILTEAGADADGAQIVADGVPLAVLAHRHALRFEPGIHVFTARAPGFRTSTEKRLALVAGHYVEATFVLARSSGTLTVRPDVDGTTVKVDGKEVGKGAWSGVVTPGTHHVEVEAPGHKTAAIDVSVPEGASVDYPVSLSLAPDAPDAYGAPHRAPPPRPKRGYMTPTLGVHLASLRLSEALDEPTGGTRRTFGGGGLGAHGGYHFTKALAVEGAGDFGTLKDSYRAKPADVLDTTTTAFAWQLTGGLRFTTPGHPVRFTVASGVGLHGYFVEAKLVRPEGIVPRKASGVAFTWTTDVGFQIDLGPLYLEPALFVDVNGVGTVRDSDGRRVFYDSPSLRYGVRFGFGVPF